MKATITFDENNYISKFITDINGEYEVDDDFDFEHLFCYYLKDDKLKLDKKKAKTQDEQEAKDLEIAELRKKLQDTDYIWNVINEGDRTREYYQDVIEQRHTWRMRIRELEG